MDNQSNGYHPKLKKIKRPINRATPQVDSRSQSNTNPFSGDNISAASAAANNEQSDLDRYLDDTALPSVDVNHVDEPRYIDEETYADEVYGPREPADALPEWLTMKIFFLIVAVSLFIGLVAGRLIFAGSKVVRNGLQGVVVNSEVPRGRARCGVAERTQGCVLYIMNPQRQDMRAKDFYDLAAQMTGRQRFMIETGNMRYANSKISPGEIVQLNIPPL